VCLPVVVCLCLSLCVCVWLGSIAMDMWPPDMSETLALSVVHPLLSPRTRPPSRLALSPFLVGRVNAYIEYCYSHHGVCMYTKMHNRTSTQIHTHVIMGFRYTAQFIDQILPCMCVCGFPKSYWTCVIGYSSEIHIQYLAMPIPKLILKPHGHG